MPRKVMIGTPIYTGQMYGGYTFSLMETMRLNYEKQGNCDFRLYCPQGVSLIQEGRNDCIRQAYLNGFDDLVFIDPDQGWQPPWVFQLLSYEDVDCVGAPVRKKVIAPETYNVRNAAGPDAFEADDQGLWTCPDMALGAGFLRLTRHAMETLWNASERYMAFAGEESRWICDVRPKKTAPDDEIPSLHGEDTLLSDRLRELGIETWLAPHMDVDHYDGMQLFRGNFVDFVKRWKAGLEEAERKKRDDEAKERRKALAPVGEDGMPVRRPNRKERRKALAGAPSERPLVKVPPVGGEPA